MAKLNETLAYNNVLNEAEKRGYEFMGWKNDSWDGVDNTYLLLRCGVDENVWSSTSYANFVRGGGCAVCGRRRTVSSRKLADSDVISTIEECCEKINITFDGFVGGSYNGNETKLILRCNKHGVVWGSCSYSYIKKIKGCPECKKEVASKNKKLSTNSVLEMIDKSCKRKNIEFVGFVGGNYNGNHNKLILYCALHDYTWDTTTYSRLIGGSGCPMCGRDNRIEKRRKKVSNLIGEMNVIHGGKYNYSKVDYKGHGKKICIICDEHGEFWQRVGHHLRGSGCPKCFSGLMSTSQMGTVGDFINKAFLVHGSRYCYKESVYSGFHKKIVIQCLLHGVFSQTPANHLRGQGCPKCKESILERLVRVELEKNTISYIQQHKFAWLINPETKRKLKMDFYLPDYNIAIECQGEQHFTKFRFEDDDVKLINRQKRDKIKFDLCRENGVELIYYCSNSHINLLRDVEFYSVENSFLETQKLIIHILKKSGNESE